MNLKPSVPIVSCFAIVALASTTCTEKLTADDKVPEAVEASFAKKYADLKAEKWEKDSNDNWEAKFSLSGTSYRADFSPSGEWIETETSLKFDDLPSAVQKAVKAEFPDEEISEVEEVDNASKGKFYDVEFKRDGSNKDVEYRENGKRV